MNMNWKQQLATLPTDQKGKVIVQESVEKEIMLDCLENEVYPLLKAVEKEFKESNFRTSCTFSTSEQKVTLTVAPKLKNDSYSEGKECFISCRGIENLCIETMLHGEAGRRNSTSILIYGKNFERLLFDAINQLKENF